MNTETKDTKKIPYKIYLEENEMPTQYYNVRADMNVYNIMIVIALSSLYAN